ncbi:histidine phosphatase family protein [Streptomyces sp. NBC_01341]|uniref:histidine phosphatase family protein n=1 Tax=Streptomyces sp. NBC_01341 TaxID=2903831 RepID=UPI002E0FAD5D|nr:histidine phosphatase family protein [Streptomyces sp. NBC_01341]
MTVRVMLISPAVNAALREARFEGDAPLDDAGARTAAAVATAGGVPGADRHLRGPSQRCGTTAEALGLEARTEPVLADWDMGRWRGRRLDDVGAVEPDAVSAWLTDPSTAPHGGESLLDLITRTGRALESLESTGGRLLAVVEPAVVRAALVHALNLPAEAFWRLDVAPLSLTELSGRSGRWNLRCGRPLS